MRSRLTGLGRLALARLALVAWLALLTWLAVLTRLAGLGRSPRLLARLRLALPRPPLLLAIELNRLTALLVATTALIV